MNDTNLFNYKNLTIFSNLNDEEIKYLENKSSLKTFAQGATIIEQGELTSTVYFLLSGTVHVVDYSRSERAVTYASLRDGDMFGEMSAIDGLPRSAWVCAITTCKVAALPGEIFLNFLKNNTEICLAMLKQLSSRIRLSDERFTDVSILGTEQRACMELIRMSKLDSIHSQKYTISQIH